MNKIILCSFIVYLGQYIRDAFLKFFLDLEKRVNVLKDINNYPENLIKNKPFNKEAIGTLISEN